MMIRYTLSVVGVSLLLILPIRADEVSWNRFRGPNGSGISHAKTVPVRWTEKDYNWEVDLPGSGHSSPVVWDKRVFVTCGDPTTALRTLLCVDVPTGRTLWKHEGPSKAYRQHRDNSYASATPAVDADGVVITWSTPEAVMLLALDLHGRELWRRNLGPLISIQGSASSPILYQDLVVLANDQEDMERSPGRRKDGPNPVGRSFVIGVDRKTGETRWQTETKTWLAGYSTPCVYQADGRRAELIFSNTAHGIMAVDPATGEITWEFGQPFRDRAVISPVVASGLVIAGHGAGLRGTRCIAVRPSSSDHGAVPTLAYTITKSLPMVPTPLVKDGRLFLWGDDGVVSCLRVATGETVWRERVGGGFYASPVWADGRLYNVSKTGEVVVLATGDAFEVLHRIPLGEPSFATPAVADGVMYLRTSSHLFSLGGPQYWKDVARNQDRKKTKHAKPAEKPEEEYAKPEKKAASPVKPAPVAKPAPEGKHELRRWAVGKHQESTGSYVRTFINSRQKQLVTLRSADGKEFNIFHRSLTQEDRAYLEFIQAETTQ